MTAKEFFEQAYRINELIDSKTEMITVLRCRAEKMTATLSPVKVQSSGTERPMADAVDLLTDLEAEIGEDKQRLCETLKSILRVIQAIPNARYQLVLEKRYLSGKSYAEIASEMNYSKETIKLLHRKALEAAVIPE